MYRFGPFALSIPERRLLHHGTTVKLGGRAFDLLAMLVERRGQVVPKSELLDRVWPGVDVGEANLPVQVLTLRQILGREAIATVPGRGYAFVGELIGDEGTGEVGAGQFASVAPAPYSARVPRPMTPLIGRVAELWAVCARIRKHRIVSLLGMAGVGKTRLAIEAAGSLESQFADGIWWVELSALTSDDLVSTAVAQAIRLPLAPGPDAEQTLGQRLRHSQALLVLDNAEHVLDGVRALVAAVHAEAPQVHLLITSQAALGLSAEHRQPLPPMSTPGDASLAACERSEAVALFAARAAAVAPGFALSEATSDAVAEVCCRLDGIPLAIELAVARLPLLGLQGLRQRLNERFELLSGTSADSPCRHRSLYAAMAWSHDLLPDEARRVFRRCGIFAGSFTLEAAQRVACDDGIGRWDVVEHLATLVDRALVQADAGELPRYRMLETARLFALDALRGSQELDTLAERHARALSEQLTVTRWGVRLWRTTPAPAEALGAELDNVRAALAWARACSDDSLALSLAAGASHVYLAASLNAEYLDAVLPFLDRVTPGTPKMLAADLYSRIADAAGVNAHIAGLDAGLRAVALWREIGDVGRLYDALTWTVAIGARHPERVDVRPYIEEGERIENPDWPGPLRSSFRWAKHRWWQSRGRPLEALVCAREQAALLAQTGCWAMHVAWGANVADCETSLGRPAEAAAHARQALQALEAMGIDDNIVGHVMDALVVALVELGEVDEALRVARRARRLLEREGDELRLIEPLAQAAGVRGDWALAARLAGHADAGIVSRREQRWPSAQARWSRLQARLAEHLPSFRLRELAREGAAMSRDEAFGLVLDASPAAPVSRLGVEPATAT